MSILSSLVKSVVGGPLQAVGNILKGKFRMEDIIMWASLAAPGGSLLNLGKGGLASLSTQNLVHNLGLQNVVKQATGIDKNMLAGKGKATDYLKAVGALNQSLPGDKPDPSNQWNNYGHQGLAVQGPNGPVPIGAKGFSPANFLPTGSAASLDIGQNQPDPTRPAPAPTVETPAEQTMPPNTSTTTQQSSPFNWGLPPGFSLPTMPNSNWASTNFWQMFGGGNNNTTKPPDFKNPKDGMTQIAKKGFGTALGIMDFWAKYKPLEQSTRIAAFNELDPSMNTTRAQKAGHATMREADRSGTIGANQAQSQGYSAAISEGIKRQAADQGIEAYNTNVSQAMDADTLARQRGAQLALLSDQDLLQGAERISALLAQIEGAGKGSGGGGISTAGALAGLVGQYLGSQGGGGTGGGGSTLPPGPSAGTTPATTPLRRNPNQFTIANFA